tara:strand:- start:1992 stop:2663 length:672 start_codon:yes stop_codon:yes gene_type:complete
MKQLNAINTEIVKYFSKELNNIKIKNIEVYENRMKNIIGNGEIDWFGNTEDFISYLDEYFMRELCNECYENSSCRNLKIDFGNINADFTDAIYMCNEIQIYYAENENFSFTINMDNPIWVFNTYSYIVIRTILNEIELAHYAEIQYQNIMNCHLFRTINEYKIFEKIMFIRKIWKKHFKEEKLKETKKLFNNYINLLNKKKTITRIFKNKICLDSITEIVNKY